MDKHQKSKMMGCSYLIVLIECLVFLCFLIMICFFWSIHNEVTSETVIFESSSPNENYILTVIQRGIRLHGKCVFYIQADDGTRIEVGLVSHETFDASKVLIEWNDDNTATIILHGDYDHTIYFTAPNIFELQ